MHKSFSKLHLKNALEGGKHNLMVIKENFERRT